MFLRRLMLLFAICPFALSSMTRAGEVALFEPWGFIPGSTTFVFEEYGCQDGSGFAYSSLYAVDLARDRWLKGTPLRALIETEACDTASARAEVRAASVGLLPEEDALVPPELLAWHARTDPDAHPHQLRFRYPTFPGPSPTGPTWTVSLRERVVEVAAACDLDSVTPKGIQLAIQPPGREAEIVYSEGNVPRSRGCPQAYALTAVYLPATFGAYPPREVFAAVVISHYPIGFEGLDRRFLVLPLLLVDPYP